MRVKFDSFVLDTARMELSRGGAAVRLSPRAFRLLSHLVAQRPRAVSKRDLLDHIWAGTIVEEANLKALVLEVRKALQERGGRVEAIRTVYGFGYAFEGDAVEEAPPSNEPRVRVEAQQRVMLLPVGIHQIGRRSDCAVYLDGRSVSRDHARLHVGQETLLLEDCGSKNGTFVADQRISVPTPLAAVVRVRCGDVDLLIARIGAESGETTTVEHPA